MAKKRTQSKNNNKYALGGVPEGGAQATKSSRH